MEEKKTTFKEKLIAFWSVKRNKIITVSVGGLLVVGIVLAIALPLGLNQGKNHTHTFASTWEHDETYHWHAATCGHDVVDGKEEHTFKDEVVDPTFDKGGYTLHTCTVCDYSYKDNETPAERETKLGIIPVINEEKNTLTYGLYPQTHVSDDAVITALEELTEPEENGWYLYNNEYYTKEAAVVHSDTYKFSDGTAIVEGTEYWFKCELIEWNILESDNGTYSLVSSLLLDTCQYAGYVNNYYNSYVRKSLNDDFLSLAFNLGSDYIQTTLVDNSASTTYSDENPFVCENTEDKVYLLSYKDYYNTSYFADISARKCKVTDYALANECNSVDGYGECWTRSPASNAFSANVVSVDGDFYEYPTSFTIVCIRPAITIKL